MYHSTALLVPDGRILTAGGGKRGGIGDNYNAEFFSPPYLFKSGPRPEINTWPSSLSYATPFLIDLGSPLDIDRVTMIRLGSVTHQFDMDQRFLELTFEQLTTDTLRVTPPSSPYRAPRGDYMIFALKDGIPSVGKYVNIQ